MANLQKIHRGWWEVFNVIFEYEKVAARDKIDNVER